MKRVLLAALPVYILFCSALIKAQTFNLASVKSCPFPNELTGSATGSHLAWALNEEGKRNLYVAEGPEFTPRKITAFNEDDGQELTSITISKDGSWVVFVRGGDHGGNWGDDVTVNATFNVAMPKLQIWSVSFDGTKSKVIGEGDNPVISPKNDSVAFIKGGQVWIAPVDGSAAAKNLFTTHGTSDELTWSPNGTQLCFTSDRGDHSMLGVYTEGQQAIQWLAPSFSRDVSPVWSSDGKNIVFVRMPGVGGAPDSILVRHHRPWEIWKVNLATGNALQLWKAPKTLAGSIPTTEGGFNLHWAANDRIVFLSYQDGWPHLYSMLSTGSIPVLLTPGNYMAEHIRLSRDGKWLVFAANTGPDQLDIDRRHILKVAVDKPGAEVITPGTGNEWSPLITGDGAHIVMISATAQRPPLLATVGMGKPTDLKLIGQKLIPANFPQKQLVTPKQVIFKAADGTLIHAQLFEPAGYGKAPKPAIVFVHGGPPRQMLLGWHYSDYYSNTYAYNQYLANLGFVVLSVNYRLGIGYGYEFHQAPKSGPAGAAEYQDIQAAGKWLAAQPQVDRTRIGIYGGSYGGYLTAMALTHDSKLFAAGVDIHGVHNWTTMSRSQRPNVFEKAPDDDLANKIAWESSPVSAMSGWTSPVLIIHGDDDRNVQFSQSVDLVRRLESQNVQYETLVIVDDTHHWMKHSNAVKVGNAIGDYFSRRFLGAVK